jgi:hypothetical protein
MASHARTWGQYLNRRQVLVLDLAHQPSELGFLGRCGARPLRLGEDLPCNKSSLK